MSKIIIVKKSSKTIPNPCPFMMDWPVEAKK
jgi:hypothetical protein